MKIFLTLARLVTVWAGRRHAQNRAAARVFFMLAILLVFGSHVSIHRAQAQRGAATLTLMDTRTLAHTGLTVSRACFGTLTFGLQNDQAAATRLVDLCFDRGVNFFDTANVYSA